MHLNKTNLLCVYIKWWFFKYYFFLYILEGIYTCVALAKKSVKRKWYPIYENRR